MSNGHGGGPPNPPEVDNVEVVYRTENYIVFRGTTSEGGIVLLTRRGNIEYFAADVAHYKVTFEPLPADNVPAG